MAERNEQRKLELISQLATQRATISFKRKALNHQISIAKEEIKEKVNLPKRLKQGIKNKLQSTYRKNPKKWFAASIVGGLIVSKLIFRRLGRNHITESTTTQEVSTKVSKGILGATSLFIIKPLFKRFVIHKAKLYFTSKYLPRIQAKFGAQEVQEIDEHSNYHSSTNQNRF